MAHLVAKKKNFRESSLVHEARGRPIVRHESRGGGIDGKRTCCRSRHGRALAIVGVVAVHLSFQFPNLPHSVTLLARMGQYGVQLFFVISAITIFMTLEADQGRCTGARHVTLRSISNVSFALPQCITPPSPCTD